MRILVPVKRVVDDDVEIRAEPDGSGVDLATAEMAMNPLDEIAVEEAPRQEAGKATGVVVVSIGPAQAVDRLRTGLATGADRGIHVRTEIPVEPLAVAGILAAACGAERPGLVGDLFALLPELDKALAKG